MRPVVLGCVIPVRRRKCRQCGIHYTPNKEQQKVCSLACSIPYGKAQAKKHAEKKHKQRKADFKKNDRSVQLKLAQQAFNKFIRLRDTNKPCISCGRYHEGQYHAGHYRTTAAQPALRFNELNCHKQCMPCNAHKSGNITEYRIELVRRIGESLVDWLEKDHKQPSKWTIEELKAIKKYYQNACKEILADPVETTPF